MELSSITNQNPWWKLGKDFTPYDKDLEALRLAFVAIRRREIKFQNGNIYLILGPRQVGKTVWIKQRIKELLETKKQRSICYLSCDTLTGKSRKELRRAIDFLIDGARDAETIYLFLDEISFINDWQYELKELADSGQTQRMIIVATGSSPASIKRGSETLPGRGISGNEHFIKPLTFKEFVLQVSPRITQYNIENSLRDALKKLINDLAISSVTSPILDNLDSLINMANRIYPFKKELDYLFNFYLLTGGFPLAINNYFAHLFKKDEKKEYIDNSAYEEFVRSVLGDLQKLGYQEHIIRQVISSIIKKTGNRYSYTDLCQSAEGITKPTLISYIGHLKDSFILNPLFAYDFNRKQVKVNGDKKVYFSDPFILSAVQAWLLGKEGYDISSDSRYNDAKIGYLIETIVAQHLTIAHEIPVMRAPETFLWFYYNNRELDFVYKTSGDEFVGIETAYQGSPRPSDAARVSQVKKYLLLTRDEYDNCRKDPAVCMMPVSLFLSVLERNERNL